MGGRLELISFVAFAIAALIGASLFAAFVTSRASGWHSLATRFAYQGSFPREKWKYSSATMRNLTSYKNCLTVAASPAGLYLSIVRPFQISHPDLFIPWSEIAVSRTKIFFWRMVRFELGREKPIPFTIRTKLAENIRAAAAASCPKEDLG